jgi:hypothetical protein
LDSADALACGNGVPVDNGLSRKRGVDVATGFLPASGVCTADSGVDEIAGVGLGDKIGVSVAVGVTPASECAVTDATGVGVVATSAGVGEFPISVGPSAVERTSD